jgi:hypothetical protein
MRRAVSGVVLALAAWVRATRFCREERRLIITWRTASLAAAFAVLWGCARQDDEIAGRDVARSAQDANASARGERAPRGDTDIGGTFGPEVHMLVTDIAAHLICDRIDGTFLPLGSEPGQPASGYLWVRDCLARRKPEVTGRAGERLAVELNTRAWRWVKGEASQLGATFALHQYVIIDARIELEGVLDVAYNRDRRIARIWLNPSRAPEVSAKAIGNLDVDTKGLWSEIVGGLASIVGASPRRQAGKKVEQQAKGEVEGQLREGISIATDLCTRAEHVGFGKPEEGALPPPPVPVPSATYVAAQLTELHPEGLAAVGPFRTANDGVKVQVRARDGGPVHTELMCDNEGTRMLESYFDGGLRALPRRKPLAETTLEPGHEATLETGNPCTPMLLARLSSPAERATLEIVAQSRRERDALVDGCVAEKASAR